MAEFITSSDVPKLVQNQFQQLATGTGYTVLPNDMPRMGIRISVIRITTGSSYTAKNTNQSI